jgi:outer membrane protein assembly factor BamB
MLAVIVRRARSIGSAILLVGLVLLVLSGCMGPRGWPGIALQGEALYVGSNGGEVLAYNSDTGRREWRWEPEAEESGSLLDCQSGGQFRAGLFYGPPALAGGIIYVGSYTGKVHAIDAETGIEAWNYEFEEPIVGSVAVAGGTLFAGTSDGMLHAVDVTTGQPKQGFVPYETEDKIWSSPVVDGGTVYFGSLDHNLYAIDADTGELKWDQPFETGGGIGSAPVIVGNLVLVGSFDGRFYAVDAATGNEKWVFDEAEDWFWSDAAYDGSIVYLASFDGKVYAVDVDTGARASTWAGPFDTQDLIRSSPVIVGDVLVVATESGTVFGVDLATGEQRWDSDLEAKVFASLVTSGSNVFISAQDDRLRALDGATGREDWSVGLVE